MARVTHVKHAQRRYRMVPSGEKTPVMRRDGTQKVTKRGTPVFRQPSVADKSQPLPNLRCDKCGTEIKPGDPYKWVKPKSGPYGGYMRTRCAACPTWRQSELSSSKMAEIYALQEEIDQIAEGCETPDDLIAAASDAAEQVRQVAEEYREGASNIEDGFGHPTYQSEELEQKADELESWADEIESTDFDEFEASECDHRNAETDDDATPGNAENCEDCGDDGTLLEDTDQWNEEMDEFMAEQRERLTDIVNECPV